jgi:hypothetical protein
VTCVASDASHNAASKTMTVTVADSTPPVIAAHGDVSVEATSGAGATVSYTAPATADVVDGARSASCAPATDTVFPVGATTVTCLATDDHGNAAAPRTFTVTVTDTTAPVIAPHANETAVATGANGAAVTYTTPAVSDIVDASVVASCSPVSGSIFSLGVTTVTCSAQDAHANHATPTTFTVTVTNTAPTFTAPANITTPSTGVSGATVTFNAVGNDAEQGAIAADCSPVSGATFAVGTTTVTCTVTDRAGATASGSFTVTVTDATAPVIVPSVTGTQINGWYTTNVSLSWSVTDGDSPIASTTGCASTSVSTDGASFSFTCEATSAGGTASRTVTFRRDATAPVLSLPPHKTVSATSPSGASVTYPAATAVDPASGVASVFCAPTSGSAFPIGTSTVTCTATDNAGHSSSATFTVTVTDTVAPVITRVTPSAASLWPSDHRMVPIALTVQASDNLGPAPVCAVTGISSNEPQNGLGDGDTPNDWSITGPLSVQLRAERAGGGNGRIYTIQVRCTDSSGNAATFATTVTVAKSQGNK